MSHRAMRKVRPRLGGALVAVLLLAGVMEIVAPSMASATSDFAFTRIAGADRYATAASAAAGAFPSGADNAILANGAKEHFPDALAASYLAGSLAGPILLTTTDSLPTATDSALQSLKTKNVTIVGGTAAVSSSVESGLKKDGYTVVRVAGANRYDTAAAVAGTPTTAVGKDPDNKVTAIVASGANFPDALVSGPIGYASAFPVEITDPAKLSPQTKQSLQNLKITHVLITGGTSAVSSSTEDEIKALGITTTRFAGTNRSDTAAKVAAYATGTLKYSDTTIDLARGDDPADSLGSAPYGGVKKSPLLLTQDSTTLGSATGDYLGAHSGTLKSGIIFGGTTAVSKAVEDEATSRARGANQVTVAASPSSLKADGASTSTITVTVKKADGTVIANDALTFTKAGTPAAACGTVPASATTNSSGQATVTYTASSTTGTCDVTATEAQASATGKVTITQTSAAATNTVFVTAPPDTLAADGADKETISIKVVGTDGNGVPGDTVNYTKSGTCGQLSAASSTTLPDGTTSVDYTSVKATGTCTITATETGTNAGGNVAVTQTGAGVKANPTTIPATTTSTSALTVTVVSSDGLPKSGATVAFAKSESATGVCGDIDSLSPATGKTDVNGRLTATYHAKTVPGICTITVTATDTNFTAAGTTKVTQTGETFTLSAAPPSIPRSVGTSSVTATIKDAAGNAPSTARTVSFSIGSPSTAGACGTLSAATAETNTTTGTASVNYTAGSVAGTCVITASATLNGESTATTRTVTITNL